MPRAFLESANQTFDDRDAALCADRAIAKLNSLPSAPAAEGVAVELFTAIADQVFRRAPNGTSMDLSRDYVYNAAGNLERLFNRNGGHIHFEYDDLDRKLKETWRVGTYGSDPTKQLRWQYDALGRIVMEVDGGDPDFTVVTDDVVNTYQYDGLGRLTEQANYDPSGPTNQGQNIGVPRVRQTYEYEFGHESGAFHDRVIRSQFGPFGGSEVAIAETISEHDRLGRLKHLDDLDNNPGAATPVVGQKSLTFSYDTAGNLTGISRSNPSTTVNSTLVYDKTSRLTSITHDLGPSGASASDIVHSYAYDNASRVTSFNTTGSGAATRAYQFDNAGQLTNYNNQAGGGFDFAFYEYDDNGNRVVRGSYNYTSPVHDIDFGNRLLDDGNYTYDYDKEGNLTKRTQKSDTSLTTEYTYDHRNRLTSVTDKNGTTVTRSVSYTYDAQGRRVNRKLDANGPAAGGDSYDFFVYDGDELSLTFTATGAAAPVLEHRYLHGPADQVLVDEVFNAAGQSTDVLWPLGDHQGTPLDIVDDNGVLRKHTTFDSFGQITSEQFYDRSGAYLLLPQGHPEAVDEAFAFTGEFRDSATGLQLHGERWYSPDNGRWLGEDPTGFDGGDANLYRYVGNSPLNYIDPSGTTQTGNPLNSEYLFFGGHSGGAVSPYKPPSTAIASGFNSSLSLGTIGKVTASALLGAAYSYVSPNTRAALSAGVSFVGAGLTSIGYMSPSSASQPRRSQTLESPTAAFIGSLWNDATETVQLVGAGLWAVATNSDARQAFGQSWQTDRVQPLGDRLYNISRAYGNSDQEIGDQNSLALLRPALGEIIPINSTAQAMEGIDMGTGQRTTNVQQWQDGLNAGSGWLLLGAGGIEAGRQYHTRPSAVTPAPARTNWQSLGYVDEPLGSYSQPSAPGGSARTITPYRDPARPGYNNGATHMDHAQARSLDGPDAPSNLRPLAAETNLRKGGFESALKADELFLIRNGMSPKDARSVIQSEIDSLRVSPPPRPMDPRVLDRLPANPLDQAYPRR